MSSEITSIRAKNIEIFDFRLSFPGETGLRGGRKCGFPAAGGDVFFRSGQETEGGSPRNSPGGKDPA